MKNTRLSRAVVAALAVALAGAGTLMSAPAEATPVHTVTSQCRAWATMSRGDRGPNVVALQHLMNNMSFPVEVDGVFGYRTFIQFRAYQSLSGLEPDAVAGPASLAQLTDGLMQRGARGHKVKALQSLLRAKDGARISVDGQFGPATRSAVMGFQRDQGISVDGVVGPQTWCSLFARR